MANGDGGDTGSKDRATVALVDAKVDGIKDLMRAEFGFIKERIAPLGTIVADLASLRRDVDALQEDVDHLKADKKSDRDWKRVNLPSIIIAAAVACGSIATALTQILH